MECPLEYIPKHLHSGNKPIIKEFDVGEMLFYRCTEGECDEPYDKKNLTDISHNRNFNNPEIFKDEDVLFNIDTSNSIEKYKDQKIATLTILNLQDEITYEKEIVSRNNESIIVKIILKHKPEVCVYSHSAFEIILNDEIVSPQNYKKTLGKKNTTFRNLRSDIRQELSSMLQTNIIDSSQDIEIIDEP